MTKDIKDIPEYGDPETWGLKVSEYEEKYKSGLGDTWKIMRQTADPEEQKELDEVELKSLKSKAIRFNKDVKEFRDISGNKYGFNEKHKINSEIRNKASKIIKDPTKLNRFMSAPDFESYQSRPGDIRKTQVSPVVTPKENYNPKPVVTPGVNQEVSEPNFETPRDPDVDHGLGSIIEKYLK